MDTLRESEVCGKGNNSGRSLSGSILGTFILSRANGVVRDGGEHRPRAAPSEETLFARGATGEVRGTD